MQQESRKAAAIRRAAVSVKHIQAQRRREKRAEVDNSRLLAFGVCDSIMHTTPRFGVPAYWSKRSVLATAAVAVIVMMVCAAPLFR